MALSAPDTSVCTGTRVTSACTRVWGDDVLRTFSLRGSNWDTTPMGPVTKWIDREKEGEGRGMTYVQYFFYLENMVALNVEKGVTCGASEVREK